MGGFHRGIVREVPELQSVWRVLRIESRAGQLKEDSVASDISFDGKVGKIVPEADGRGVENNQV